MAARYDLQLKGSGTHAILPWRRWPNPPSGQSSAGYIVSEAMSALGVPTTRALAAVGTGEKVMRQEGPLPGGVFTRVASSHIRVGTFQYFSGTATILMACECLPITSLRDLLPGRRSKHKILIWLCWSRCANAQADLIAQWMSLGFYPRRYEHGQHRHLRETIDYMVPARSWTRSTYECVYSSIDSGGRYA